MAKLAEDVFAQTMSPEMLEASDRRAQELIEEFDTLQQLRKSLDLTQEAIGSKLGKKQVSIAQLEKRSDLLLSTLKTYVEALGGELELTVRFKDKPPVRLIGFAKDANTEPAQVKQGAAV